MVIPGKNGGFWCDVDCMKSQTSIIGGWLRNPNHQLIGGQNPMILIWFVVGFNHPFKVMQDFFQPQCESSIWTLTRTMKFTRLPRNCFSAWRSFVQAQLAAARAYLVANRTDETRRNAVRKHGKLKRDEWWCVYIYICTYYMYIYIYTYYGDGRYGFTWVTG